MKRLALLIAFLLMVLYLFGQITVCEANYVSGLNPAPCSIADPTQRVDQWVIRVGIYRQHLNSYETVVLIPIGGYNYYYYAPEGKLLWTEAAARDMADRLRRSGVFCDAQAIPNPVMAIGFKRYN